MLATLQSSTYRSIVVEKRCLSILLLEHHSSSSMGWPTAMHLSLKGLLSTPEAHHEAYQSMFSEVPQTTENNLSGPPVEIHHPCPNYQRWYTTPLLLKGNQRASVRQFHPAHHTFYRTDEAGKNNIITLCANTMGMANTTKSTEEKLSAKILACYPGNPDTLTITTLIERTDFISLNVKITCHYDNQFLFSATQKETMSARRRSLCPYILFAVSMFLFSYIS
ncbi:hypothetical protein J6590_045787 [Homalodisca vitripennis]|nr:hypothetical protein J6590_045787 [Homalodisca vitripennis]